MAGKRKKYSSSFKAKVALEAIKGRQTTRELAAKYEIHPTLINNWKAQLLAGVEEVFEGKRGPKRPEESSEAALYEEIGRLKMKLDWLKKKADLFED